MVSFDLTAVVAEAHGWPGLGPTLSSIAESCHGLRVEVIVVAPREAAWSSEVEGMSCKWIRTASASLVPVRWGEGIAVASAPVVACLTTELAVLRSWAPTLLEGLRAGAVGAAGAIALAPGASAATTGMYLLRFGRFLPRSASRDEHARHLPGDGAVYLRDRVLEHADLLASGFWEVDFHQRWIAAGHRLSQESIALTCLHGSTTVRDGLALRYRHGLQYGKSMVQAHGSSRLRHVALAPLLPFVLTVRAMRRAAGSVTSPAVLARGVIPLLLFSAAWSAGEMLGAWRAEPDGE